MKSIELRKKFLDYFARNGHTEVPSSSLIPHDDPSLLFTNAGMNQFKNVFLGIDKREYSRATSIQKCVRAGGKHNDLENVGFTARHHTFFEMLGNFSFGDYFKKEAIHYAWEVLTKEYGIPKDKLYVTVFDTDDEAAEIWHKQEGVPRERIFRFGEKDNFWRMGDTGPCGPSSEIFYDHGPDAGKETDPYKGILSGEDRYVEIWNLVFMQYFEKAPGQLDPLPKPSVDTGSGFERVAAVLQGESNNYNTDLFLPMINKASALIKFDYVKDARILARDPELQRKVAALRVIADHSRAAATLIADGAVPSNEGRGYVLRRIIRRAIRYAQNLSDSAPIFMAMVEEFIKTMGEVYPELQARKTLILTNLKDEQERFLQTLASGNEILNSEIKKLKAKNAKLIPGEIAFKLYDTYGFPLDLTHLIAREHGLDVQEERFQTLLEDSKKIARASWKGRGTEENETHMLEWSAQFPATQYIGYEETMGSAKVLGLSDGQSAQAALSTDQTGWLVSDRTSFYAEGGGQVGDMGSMRWPQGAATVSDCVKKKDVFLHRLQITQGELKQDQEIQLQVSLVDRRKTAANHSATHLMHAALRKVLGSHVAQAGSLVDPEKLRFDFSHGKTLSREEIEQIEHLVNNEIFLGHPVTAKLMSYDAALKSGALALFGEKYGDEVRVLKMGEFSCELCGGTHVNNTSEIQIFKIVSETGVSAGVRRIEALTGMNALQFFEKHLQENTMTRDQLGIQENWTSFLAKAEPSAPVQVQQLKEQIKNLEAALKKIKASQVDIKAIVMSATAFSAHGQDLQLILSDVPIEERELLSQVSDQILSQVQSAVVFLMGQGEGAGQRPTLVAVSKNLIGKSNKIHAGKILKTIAEKHGGKGGGRPEFAQGAISSAPSLQDLQNSLA